MTLKAEVATESRCWTGTVLAVLGHDVVAEAYALVADRDCRRRAADHVFDRAPWLTTERTTKGVKVGYSAVTPVLRGGPPGWIHAPDVARQDPLL
jgi:hypothetical protein